MDFFGLSASVSQVEAQHCVWHGECGESPLVPGKKYNCNYTGPPIPLPSEGYELLQVHAGLCRIILLLYFTPWESSIKVTCSVWCLPTGALSWL